MYIYIYTYTYTYIYIYHIPKYSRNDSAGLCQSGIKASRHIDCRSVACCDTEKRHPYDRASLPWPSRSMHQNGDLGFNSACF